MEVPRETVPLGVDWARARSWELSVKANWEDNQSLEELSGFFLKVPGP